MDVSEQAKTEWRQNGSPNTSISVNGEIVKILNIWAPFLDPSMDMAAHVTKAVKSANYHLRNIRRIRIYLTAESTKSAVTSLVTPGFDY